MDPFSIAQLAGTLLKRAYQVYAFCESARVVDRDIQALHGQIEGLTNVLRSLNDLFAEQVSERSPRHQQLWNSVAQALEACRPTLHELETKLEEVAHSGSTHKAFQQAIKAARLTLKKDDIQRLMSAMQTHSINLQLAVGMVQVIVSASTPEAVAHELAMRFERLEKMIVAVDERLASQAAQPQQAKAEENILDEVQLDDNTRELRRSASTVISSASTISSIALSRNARRASDSPVFNIVRNPRAREPDQPPGVEESTTGSEFGPPVRRSRRVEIHEWIMESSLESPDKDGDVDQNASTASPSDPLTSIFSGMSPGVHTNADESMTEELFDESSDEDELQVHVIRKLLLKGDAEAEAGDFKQAEEIVAFALNDARSLTAKSLSTLNLNHARLKYAQYCLKSGNAETAEDVFLDLIREPIKDSQTVARILHAYHGLAQLHLGRGNLDAARANCMQALKGRRRSKSIGKSHLDYFASLRLIALISWAKGDQWQAEIYSDMLPEEQRIPTSSFNEALEIECSTIRKNGVENFSSEGKDIDDPFVTNVPKDTNIPSSPLTDDADSPWVDFGSPHPSSPRVSSGQSPAEATSGGFTINRYGENAQTSDYLQKPVPRSPQELQNTHNTALIKAIQEGDVGLARVICSGFGRKGKPDIDAKGPTGDTPLLIAVKAQNSEMCDFILSQNPSIDLQDEAGQTALIIAAALGDRDLCAQLLCFGPNIDQADKGGATALMHAARSNSIATCKVLLEAGANVEMPDNLGNFPHEYATSDHLKSQLRFSEDIEERLDGAERSKSKVAAEAKSENAGTESQRASSRALSRLFAAIRLSHTEDVRLILRHDTIFLDELFTCRSGGKGYMGTALHFAIRERKLEICKLLLEHELDVNMKDSANWTPLDLAIESSSLEVAKCLVARGASLTVDTSSQTPLVRATITGQLAICELLLSNGADPNIRTPERLSVLHCAAIHGQIDIYNSLVQRGANEATTTPRGLNTLMLAAGYGHTDLCKQLVKKHNVNSLNGDMTTALHLAMRHPQVCALLILNGAQLEIKDAFGATPLMFGVKNSCEQPENSGYQDAIDVLLKNRADPNTQNSKGTSPLQHACVHGRSELARNLLANGANHAHKDYSGVTALMLAAVQGHLQTCQVLIDAGADRTITNPQGRTAADFALNPQVKKIVSKKWYSRKSR